MFHEKPKKLFVAVQIRRQGALLPLALSVEVWLAAESDVLYPKVKDKLKEATTKLLD